MKMKLDIGLIKSLLVFGAVIEARDAYTGGHVWRVARFSEIIARKAGLNNPDTFRASIGGFIHDIGKVGIPDSILNKPGPLTDTEYKIMRTHPVIGHNILAAHPLAPLVIDAVSCHHERQDGGGYPEHLPGNSISIYSKIVIVADAFDAMTSTRSYREGMTKERAIAILRENSDSQFDSEIVEHLIALCDSGECDNIIGHSDEESPLLSCPSCGPIIAVPRKKKHGDKIHCHNCKSHFILNKKESFFAIEHTGEKIHEAQNELDIDQIDEIARRAPNKIHI